MAVIAALLSAGPIHAKIERTETLRFDIEFNGRQMGQHEFQITFAGEQGDQAIAVRSRVEMRYRIAFIPVFRYQHSADERWRNGCLTTLQSTTNDDGKRFALQGNLADDGFAVTHSAPEPEQTLISDTCPATFAYWQPQLLERPALINAQTGRLEPVSVIGAEPTVLDNQPARRWTITTEQGSVIELWYADDDGQWLRLKHQSADGTLIYRRSNS